MFSTTTAIIFYILAFCALASAQAPLDGVQKYTIACSNPHAAYSWLSRYLPVKCAGGGYTNLGNESVQLCDAGHECGYIGRTQLLHDGYTPFDSGFGLHTVHSIARPEGPLTLQAIETAFDQHLAPTSTALDPFTDSAVVLYAPDGLDRYAAKFKHHDQHFRCIQSTVGDSGATLYSLVAHIPSTVMVVEICSVVKPTASALSCCTTPVLPGTNQSCSWVNDAVPRISEDVLTENNATQATPGLLVPLMVSKAVSAAVFNATVGFYHQGLGATQVLSAAQSGIRLANFRLPGSTVQVRVVTRPDPTADSSSVLSVRDLEVGKRAAHAQFVVSPLCGFSKLMDTHFAWDHYSTSHEYMMERYVEYFEAHGYKYHIWGSYAVDGTPNLYVEDPTGDTVQIDANWEQEPVGAAADALLDMCSQGNCTAVVEGGCAAELKETCGGLGGLGAPCNDCVYDGLVALRGVCSYQEMLTYCVKTSSAS